MKTEEYERLYGVTKLLIHTRVAYRALADAFPVPDYLPEIGSSFKVVAGRLNTVIAELEEELERLTEQTEPPAEGN